MSDRKSLKSQLQELIQVADARGLREAGILMRSAAERSFVFRPGGSARFKPHDQLFEEITRAEDRLRDAAEADVAYDTAMDLAAMIVGEPGGPDAFWMQQTSRLLAGALLHRWYARGAEPAIDTFRTLIIRGGSLAEAMAALDAALAPMLDCLDRRVVEPASRYLDSSPMERECVLLQLSLAVERRCAPQGPAHERVRLPG